MRLSQRRQSREEAAGDIVDEGGVEFAISVTQGHVRDNKGYRERRERQPAVRPSPGMARPPERGLVTHRGERRLQIQMPFAPDAKENFARVDHPPGQRCPAVGRRGKTAEIARIGGIQCHLLGTLPPPRRRRRGRWRRPPDRVAPVTGRAVRPAVQRITVVSPRKAGLVALCQPAMNGTRCRLSDVQSPRGLFHGFARVRGRACRATMSRTHHRPALAIRCFLRAAVQYRIDDADDRRRLVDRGIASGGDLVAVSGAVIVAVGVQGIGAQIDLRAIQKTVAVAVGEQGIRAPRDLGAIIEPIAVAVWVRRMPGSLSDRAVSRDSCPPDLDRAHRRLSGFANRPVRRLLGDRQAVAVGVLDDG